VGVGLAQGKDVAQSIEKATQQAKKHMIKVRMTRTKSIPHNVEAKYCASRVWITPSAGHGLVAGGAVRTMLELAGVRDVSAKILSRSKNHLNNLII